MKKILILMMAVMLPSFLVAQGLSVPEGKENINLVTGDFSYNIPLLTVPGPNGGYPIAINYNAGIKVDQEASWVGLGWSLGVGSINRSVNKYPDDWHGGSAADKGGWIETSSFNQDAAYVFPEYSNKANLKDYMKILYNTRHFSSLRYGIGCTNLPARHYDNTNDYDYYKIAPQYSVYNDYVLTRRTTDYSGIILPAYDSYQVSAYGLNGKMSPRLLKFGGFNNSPASIKIRKDYAQNNYHWNSKLFTTQSNLHYSKLYFDNEPSGYAKITAGYYERVGNSPLCDSYFNYFKINNPSEYGGQLETGIENYFNPDDYRKGGIKYVETLRKNEGADHAYICGFRITDEKGTTFLFEEYVNHELGCMYSMEQNTIQGELPELFEEIKRTDYATEWLLTGIRGADYKDINNNGIIDDEDEGYWVKFNYGKWSEAYITRTPSIDINELENFYYSNFANFGFIVQDKYYLNSVETKSHIAYFIKDIDNSNGVNFEESDLYTPYAIDKTLQNPDGSYDIEAHRIKINSQGQRVLKLSKIILARKDDLVLKSDEGEGLANQIQNSIIREYSIMDGYIEGEQGVWEENPDEDPYVLVGESPSHAANLGFGNFNNNVLDASDIIGHEEEIANKALQIIEFNHDYSLCKPNQNENGKLTLNSINFKNANGNNLFPPFEFDYSKNSIVDYIGDSENYKDTWGYYYPSSANSFIEDIDEKTNSDEWSLTDITNPLGKTTTISYESDQYTEVVSNIDNQSIKFPIKRLYLKRYNISGSMDEIRIYFDELSNPLGDLLQVGEVYDIFFQNTFEGYYYDDFGINIKEIYIEGNVEVAINSINTSENYINISSDFFNSFVDNSGPIILENLKPSLKESSNRSFMIVPISFPEPNVYFGGGLRVKSIEYKNRNNEVENYKTFSYSQGRTTYAPVRLPRYIPLHLLMPAPCVYYRNVTELYYGKNDEFIGKTSYEYDVFNSTENLLQTDFEFGYKKLGSQVELDKYLWVETLSDDQLLIEDENCDDANINIREENSTLKIHNQLSRVGRILSKKIYSPLGKIKEINYDYYNFDESNLGVVQEVFEEKLIESFYSKPHEDFEMALFMRKFMNQSTVIANYPSILKSTTTKTIDGLSSKITIEEYDFISGEAVKTKIEGPNGEVEYIESIPAYKVYKDEEGIIENWGMGSKVFNINNKNILAAKAATYKNVDGNESSDIVGASLNTFKKDLTVISFNPLLNDGNGDYVLSQEMRTYVPDRSIAWEGALNNNSGQKGKYLNFNKIDETSELWTSFEDGFNWSGGWYSMGAITKYTSNLKPVETKNNKEIFASSRFGYNNSRLIANAINSKYTEFTFSGFENVEQTNVNKSFLEGDVSFVEGEAQILVSDNEREEYPENNFVPGINAHTGNFLMSIVKNGPKFTSNCILDPNTGEEGIVSNKEYEVSVWVLNPQNTDLTLSIKITDQNYYYALETKHINDYVFAAGDWKLYKAKITTPATIPPNCRLEASLKVNIPDGIKVIYADDFKVQPLDAAVNAKVYDKRTGRVLSEMGSSHLATKYEYDEAGRLKAVYQETEDGFVKVKENNYNFKRFNE